jgi:predicted GIY-YIG superfamily endonuclease
MSFWVYILLCADGRFYVGQASDLEERIERHNAGRGAVFTAVRLPVKLVFAEKFISASSATAREIQIKKWSHAKKAALIQGDAQRLRALSVSRDHSKPAVPQP